MMSIVGRTKLLSELRKLCKRWSGKSEAVKWQFMDKSDFANRQ